MLMSADQCRAARGYLGWSREELAKAAGVSRAMVTDFESGKRETLAVMRNALQDVLEAKGVEFPERTGGKAAVVFPERVKGDEAGDE